MSENVRPAYALLLNEHNRLPQVLRSEELRRSNECQEGILVPYAEIQVSGDSAGGVLALTVYSDDERILSRFFVDIRTDVRTHVDILEENNTLRPTACPTCGAPLDLSGIDQTRTYVCGSCGMKGQGSSLDVIE